MDDDDDEEDESDAAGPSSSSGPSKKPAGGRKPAGSSSSSVSGGALYQVHWHRIVLDEAQVRWLGQGEVKRGTEVCPLAVARPRQQ